MNTRSRGKSATKKSVKLKDSVIGNHGVSRSIDGEVVIVTEQNCDENLLERALTQWQVGEWESLAKLDRNTLQQDPDRAKLALLAAAGHLQRGDTQAGRQFTRLAQDWGCSKKLFSQILVAGVHNSLGRAAAIAGKQNDALKHFENAIVLGAPGRDLRLTIQARIGKQLAQLELPKGCVALQPAANNGAAPVPSPTLISAESFSTSDENVVISGPDYTPLTKQFLNDLVARLVSSEEVLRQAALEDAAACLQEIANDRKPLAMAMTNLVAHGDCFTFVHVDGDYIPRKIAVERQFYESTFLEVLGAFHQPGGMIIDGGANIGNHTIYFASVLRAEVIAIEPEPHNATCLAINVALNGVSDRVRQLRNALGPEAGLVTLRMNVEANFGTFTGKAGSDMNNPHTANEMRVNVGMTTLDDALERLEIGHKPISILKLDVEGMELEVLQGADRLIQTSLPLVAVECFTYSDLTRVVSRLERYGYFQVDILNATPTFIFASCKNPFHLARLSDHLRSSIIRRAMKYSGFAP